MGGGSTRVPRPRNCGMKRSYVRSPSSDKRIDGEHTVRAAARARITGTLLKPTGTLKSRAGGPASAGKVAYRRALVGPWL
jgi:hypothetical protein